MTTRIIVLNWNGSEWLDRCLASLAAQTLPPSEIVVVDNASTDGSVAQLRERWPGVTVVALSSNEGFAGGNNRGAEGAHTDALVFLNNDTYAEPGWLEGLVRAAAEDPARGLIASRIVYVEPEGVLDSAGDGYLRCGGAYKRKHGRPEAQATEPGEVFGACGAGFLIRRHLFSTLGGFDEQFFMVYEDVDLSYRAQLAGARVWYAADAIVRHVGGGSLGRVSDAAVFYGQRNLEWTWIKNTPASLWWRSLPMHVIYNVAGAVAYARHGQLWPWVKGKWAALGGVPAQWKKRRPTTLTPAAVQALWEKMDADWWGIKRAEKKFDW